MAANPKESAAFCAPTWSWPAASSLLEAEVVERVNAARALGGTCGARGAFPAGQPVRANAALRCSARAHTATMAQTGAVSHSDPDGTSPFERILHAGFAYEFAGEAVAAGARSPAEVVQAWLGSDDHCAVLLNPAFDSVGVGHAPSALAADRYGQYWTVNIAK